RLPPIESRADRSKAGLPVPTRIRPDPKGAKRATRKRRERFAPESIPVEQSRALGACSMMVRSMLQPKCPKRSAKAPESAHLRRKEAIMTSEALDRATTELGAVELSDGQYAHYDEGMGRWYIVTAADLESYVTDYLGSDDEAITADAYSHWCAGTVAEEMPRGWDPADPEAQVLSRMGEQS